MSILLSPAGCVSTFQGLSFQAPGLYFSVLHPYVSHKTIAVPCKDFFEKLKGTSYRTSSTREMAVSDKPGKRKLQAAQEQGRQRGPGKPSPPARPCTPSTKLVVVAARCYGAMRFQRLKRALPGSRRVTKPRGASGAGPQGTRWLCGTRTTLRLLPAWVSQRHVVLLLFQPTRRVEKKILLKSAWAPASAFIFQTRMFSKGRSLWSCCVWSSYGYKSSCRDDNMGKLPPDASI